jgi:hypothetical protein
MIRYRKTYPLEALKVFKNSNIHNNDVSFQLNDQRNDKIILYCSLTLGFIVHSFIYTAIGRFETNLRNSKLNDFHEKTVTFENHKI